MSRFRLGTLSASAALATTVFLVLFGAVYAVLIPALIYAVPCAAAFKKTPAPFWRTFTVASVLVASIATAVCTFGFRHDLDGTEMIGFPFAHPLSLNWIYSLPFIVNAVFSSGLCLFPLCLLSTLDTLRKKPAHHEQTPATDGSTARK